MRRREDYEPILLATLERLFQYHMGFIGSRVGPSSGPGQLFSLVPMLGGYITAGASREVRRYLADSFAFTPNRVRLPAQWVVGSVLASRMNPLLCAGFRVSGAVESSQDLLVIPGNQRIRLFDFRRGVCVVAQKEGFTMETLRRELDARRGRPAPWVPVLFEDAENGLFEEPILDAFSLPRLPPWRSQRKYTRMAFADRDAATRGSRRVVDSGQAATRLEQEIRRLLRRASFDAISQDMLGWLSAAAATARRAPSVVQSDCHGDFQPGNVLVERTASRIWLIDWEHSRVAHHQYDELVWRLGTRRGRGLAARMKAFLGGSSEGTLEDRRSALAWLIMHDMEFFLRESVAGPYTSIPAGLTTFCDELRLLGQTLEGVLQ